MDGQSIEERIRKWAYALWLADGALEGCSDDFWCQARETLEDEIVNGQLNGKLGEM
ncbi:DUF2934 domain-containing protein [Caballeronia sp. SBC1]|uniref:DUF2934 domain-containing protein n=1 Tax=Caballeronia sp. SBC1 TaxID=2705548 RepID=UPI001408C430|nr:DUF2934 domain-containing protein [Caballeronia sp. SBC1]